MWYEIPVVVLASLILIVLIFLSYVTYKQATGAQKGVNKINSNVGKIKDVAISAVPVLTQTLSQAAQTYREVKTQQKQQKKKSQANGRKKK